MMQIASAVAKNGAVRIRINVWGKLNPVRGVAGQKKNAVVTVNKTPMTRPAGGDRKNGAGSTPMNAVGARQEERRDRVEAMRTVNVIVNKIRRVNIAGAKMKSTVSNIRMSAVRPKVGAVRRKDKQDPAVAKVRKNAAPTAPLTPMTLNVREARRSKMWVKLTSSQFRILSEFCNDVAKGLFLGVALGQAGLTEVPLLLRLIISFVLVSASLSFLYFAVSFSGEVES